MRRTPTNMLATTLLLLIAASTYSEKLPSLHDTPLQYQAKDDHTAQQQQHMPPSAATPHPSAVATDAKHADAAANAHVQQHQQHGDAPVGDKSSAPHAHSTPPAASAEAAAAKPSTSAATTASSGGGSSDSGSASSTSPPLPSPPAADSGKSGEVAPDPAEALAAAHAAMNHHEPAPAKHVNPNHVDTEKAAAHAAAVREHEEKEKKYEEAMARVADTQHADGAAAADHAATGSHAANPAASHAANPAASHAANPAAAHAATDAKAAAEHETVAESVRKAAEEAKAKAEAQHREEHEKAAAKAQAENAAIAAVEAIGNAETASDAEAMMGGGGGGAREEEGNAAGGGEGGDATPQTHTAHSEEAMVEHEGENPLCHSWAVEGECMRNPQYMWSACHAACSSMTYIDADQDCSGWADIGECEKNPDFMFQQCNSSCVKIARDGLRKSEAHARPNPHLLASDDDPNGGGAAAAASHRAATFVPVLLMVVAVLGGCAFASTAFGPYIAEQHELLLESFSRQCAKISHSHPQLAPYVNAISVTKFGSALICLYYLNESLTVMQTNPIFAALFPLSGSDGVWQHHVAWVDASNLIGGAAAICCLLGIRPLTSGSLMLLDTLVDSYVLLYRIALNFVYGRGLYINELMAKKFSLLGCVGLLIACRVHQSEGQRAFSGLLLESSTISNKVSIGLLFGRLLIAVLFLYVGLSELHRLLFQPFTPYLPGDGHDVVWPKAVELVLSLPFILGWRTELVSRMLALSLILEALYAWSWWAIPGDAHTFAHHRRAIHYREHFVTNVATAGGLLLLQKIGAGKYTVDELMKKQD